MVMSWIWLGILSVSILCSFLMGRGSELAAGILEGAQQGVTLGISLAGSLCLWSGVGKVLERAGITAHLARLLRPLLCRVFPSSRKDKKLQEAISGNICANFFGLGNAATPMGIQAIKRMIDPQNATLATNEMCRLIVLNTASIQLLPTNVSAIRANLGAAAPFDILPAVWITSLLSAGLGVCAAWVLGRVWRK